MNFTQHQAVPLNVSLYFVEKSIAQQSAAVADLIRWHSTAKDEAAEWPGRAAQESAISAAGGDGGGDDSDSSDGGSDDAPDGGAPDDAAPGGKNKPSGTAG